MPSTTAHRAATTEEQQYVYDSISSAVVAKPPPYQSHLTYQPTLTISHSLMRVALSFAYAWKLHLKAKRHARMRQSTISYE